MAWQVPVTNRTGGYYNTTDLNRVESNTQYISDFLKTFGYITNLSYKQDWTYADFPTYAEMTRYLSNISELELIFIDVPATLPSTMDKSTYVDWNNIEQVLLELKEFAESTKKGIHRLAFTLGGAKRL